MQKNEVVFVINEHERIKLFLSDELDAIFRWDYASAVYIKDDGRELNVFNDFFVFEFIDVLNRCLEFVLIGDCKVDVLTQENLGYLWNVHLHKVAKKIRGQERPKWDINIGTVLDGRGTASWLYEIDGKFYFEIIPVYRWFYGRPDSEEKAEYITYRQFMKDYKTYPAVIVELSTETIYEWLEQTRQLLALIRLSDEEHRIIMPETEKLSQLWLEMQKNKDE